MKKILLLVITGMTLLSCNKNDNNIGLFPGPDETIQKGKGRSWINLNSVGAPTQLGITLDDAALNSMPVQGEESNFKLALSNAAKLATPFDHIEIGWNPHGHEPVGVYNKPHFDFHFYMVSDAEVNAATDPVKLDAIPAAEYVPKNYVPGPAVPKMGKHFIDITSPELNGKAFNETFIYGTYDGKVTFYEPMITLAFLLSAESFERQIPQPEKYMKPGYYPTTMSIAKHDGVTDIILSGFVKR